MTEEIEALNRKDTTEGINNTNEPEEVFPDTPPPDVTDTSLTLPEAIRKYHAPEESTKYSVTLWGGACFHTQKQGLSTVDTMTAMLNVAGCPSATGKPISPQEVMANRCTRCLDHVWHRALFVQLL